MGITLASLGLGWVGEPAISHLIVEPLFEMIGLAQAWYADALAIFIGFAVITFMHIVLGELAPKSLAIQKSEVTSLWLSAPLMLFYKLFLPDHLFVERRGEPASASDRRPARHGA